MRPADPHEIARWAACAAVVVLAHAGAAAAFVTWAERSPPEEPAAALVIELAPMPVSAPAPPNEVAPGPEQQQNDAPPEVAPETEPTPDPPIETAEITPQDPPPEPTAPAPPEKAPPPPPPAPAAAVALPPPPPPRPPAPKRKPKPRIAQTTAPKASAAKLAARAAAPVEGQPKPTNSNAVPSWRSALVAQLERNKQYPAAARERREEGVAQVAFAIDRAGHILSSRIVRSSGSAALDEATLGLLRRASPLPPPPPEVPGSHINLTVPIRYAIR